jgi:exodeoxyribonuclease VII small subunit
MSFEDQLARLQEIVALLEDPGLPLERGVELFREGAALAASCRERLEKAANEVKVLQEGVLRDFAPGQEEDA